MAASRKRGPRNSAATRRRRSRLPGVRAGGRATSRDDRRRISMRRLMIIAALALVLVMFVPTVNSGIRQWQRIGSLENQNSALESEITDLQGKQAKLKDPVYLAGLARQEQQYVKKGETVYIVIDEDGTSTGEQTIAQADRQANKGDSGRPWYVELLDSLKAVGTATQEQ